MVSTLFAVIACNQSSGAPADSTVDLSSAAPVQSGLEQSLHVDKQWNQLHGSRGDSVTSAALPVDFGESQNVRWKTPIHDEGFSSPVIWEDQIWLTSATPDGTELYAIAVDLESGEIIHDIKVFDVAEPQRRVVDNNNYASPTPVVEQGRVYVHFGSVGTACLDTNSGKKLWERLDFACEHETRPASSPIINGDSLFVAFDGIDVQYFVSMQKQTGETLWKRDRDIVYENPGNWDNKAFGTAKIIEHEGRKQVISPAARAVISYDPETGNEHWRVKHPAGANNGCPPLYQHGLIYVSGRSGDTAMAAIDPSGSGDVTDTHIVWNTGENAPLYSSIVIFEDLLFMVSDNGVASCLDAKTGDVNWSERIGGNYWASPFVAEGKVYFSSKQGKVTVIEASREFKELAKVKFESGFATSPAVTGNALILRTLTHLYYID
jgi:outer membrane protein assembly factor BamB